jgi:uncharacterized membrane protein
MNKSWSDLSLWLLGLAIMIIGAACPIYVFSQEGYDSIFGDIVYVLAGVLLFSAGLGVTVFRTWLIENPPASTSDEARPPANADA